MSKQCKKCGAIMDDADMFCDSCGTAYQVEVSERTIINNPFSQLVEQLKCCKSSKEVDLIREKVEREYDDYRDREYLLRLVDEQY